MKTSLNMIKQVIFLSLVLLLANCSKESDPTPGDLIVGNWKISTAKVTVKVGSLTLVEYLVAQGLTAAEAQDIEAAFTDDLNDIEGNLEIKSGGTYSSTSGGSTDTGKWELTPDGKTLTLDKGTADEFVFTVATLSATNLNLTGDQTDDSNGVTLTIHIEIGLTR